MLHTTCSKVGAQKTFNNFSYSVWSMVILLQKIRNVLTFEKMRYTCACMSHYTYKTWLMHIRPDSCIYMAWCMSHTLMTYMSWYVCLIIHIRHHDIIHICDDVMMSHHDITRDHVSSSHYTYIYIMMWWCLIIHIRHHHIIHTRHYTSKTSSRHDIYMHESCLICIMRHTCTRVPHLLKRQHVSHKSWRISHVSYICMSQVLYV